MPTPEYTIICSTRNRPNVLSTSLKKTRGVIPGYIPIIVFDDASDDPSLLDSSLSGISNISIIYSKTRVGPGAGRNECMRQATTPYCLSLDDDCYLEETPDFSRLMNRLDSDSDLAVVSLRYYNPINDFYGPETDQPGYATTMLGGGSLLRKDLVLKAGGYLDWLVYGSEDSELATRLNLLGYRIWYEPSVIVIHEHVPVARDHKWATFYYVRNALLISVLHKGFAKGFAIGLFRALRWGYFHPSNEIIRSQSFRAIAAGIRLIAFCLQERKRLHLDAK